MYRLKLFTLEFFLILIFFLLFNNIELIDTFVFIVFLISSFLYIFSFETLPNKKKYLKIPQVNNYYYSKMNSYTYLMAFQLVIISLLYLLSTTLLSFIKQGWLALALWIIMIFNTYFITKYYQRKILFNNLLNYIFNYFNFTLNHEQVLKILRQTNIVLSNNSNISKESLLKNIIFIFKNDIDADIIKAIVYIYLEYNNIALNDEIKIINNL